jgi:hypothetical protein
METVILKHNGSPVVHMPMSNFKTFAPDKILGLRMELTEGDTHRWRLHSYDAPAQTSPISIKRWASWMKNQDLRAVADGGSEHGTKLLSAIIETNDITLADSGYQDALVDAWMSWVRETGPAGTLSVDRLRDSGLQTCHSCLNSLMGALILHHDAEAALAKDKTKLQYRSVICDRVRDMAMSYFFQPDREPKDPLQLSDDEFCKKYHSHHKKDVPCYKTRSLPWNAWFNAAQPST